MWFTSYLTPKLLTALNYNPLAHGYHLKLKSLSKEFVSSHRSSLNYIQILTTLELLPGQIKYLNFD